MSAEKKHTILFLAANPNGTDRRALDREARAIRAELRASGHRDRFELQTRWATEPLDLLRELRALAPAVVHFSGPGGQGGLCFHDADSRARIVPAEALAETFGAAGASVMLVVLSACYSDSQAEALLAHVDCVVGMRGAIHDDAARCFAIGFYGALGERASVATAFEQGRAAIRLEGLPEGDRPRLRVRAGVDAGRLVPAAAAPELAEPACPYPGMRPYAADDASHFHGRAAAVDELLGRLRAGERELYVIGPSGSGKSSVVGAGLLPRLARGAPGLGPFVVRSMRPGEHPAARLAEVLELSPWEPGAPAAAIAALLAHRAPGALVLIVVDQLEELFALASADERAMFLGAVQALRTEPRCVLVFVLRADFFGDLMESPLWTDRRMSRVEVAPLRGEALREAIASPARDVGVHVEPELIERLLADAASEPGILPLLQETLLQLWDRRRERRRADAGEAAGARDERGLLLADYEALGDGRRSGLAVALSRRADATLRALPPAQEAIARRILLRLISFGEGRSDTRRQQPRGKLCSAGDVAADFDEVLRRLIADRLLTTDDDDRGEARVDLAHEVMITAWPTLAGWIQTRRADELHRRQLEAEAAHWVERGRGAAGLLDPIELAEAEAWQRTESARELGESADVATLIAASKAAHDRQRRRRRGFVAGAFAALAALAVVVAALAVVARRQARETEHGRRENQRLLAQSYQEAGRRLLLEGHAQEAIPYLVAARRRGEEGSALRMLFWKAARALPLAPLLEHEGAVHGAAFSPDGARVVTASADHTARVWDAGTGAALAAPLAHRGPVWSAAFSPDGARIVTASADHTARIWDAAAGQPLAAPLAHQGAVSGAAFSPDGARILTASWDRTARLWNAATGEPLAGPLAHPSTVWIASFSPDGARILTADGDGTARVWDAATGVPLAVVEHRDSLTAAAFSPDGARILTASFDGTARVWHAATGAPAAAPLVHQRIVWSAAFSPDGARVVTASFDGTARVWSADAGAALAAPLAHRGTVWSAAFSPDGARVVTAGDDATARIWDAATGQPLAGPLEHRDAVFCAAFGPDGARVVTASADHTARVWNAATGQPLTAPLPHQGAVYCAAFSPDGARAVTASADHTARLWDAATGGPLATPLPHQGPVYRAAFGPGGARVVTASFDGTARVWDAATGRPLTAPLVHRDKVGSAAFSPDGARVVTASFDGTARIWDAATGEPITAPLVHRGWVWSAAFSPDGTRVVTASADHTARLWDAATGAPLASPLGHRGDVCRAAFSPDGARIVTASADDAAHVWDAATGKPLATDLLHAGILTGAAFSPDGSRVVTTSHDHTARLWDTRLDARTLDEWSTLAGRSPFVLSGSVHVRRGAGARAGD